MRFSSVALAVLLFACSLFAGDDFKNATAEELALKKVDFAPGASAVILDWDVKHDDEKSFATEHVRIKVLTAEGKKYGDIEIPYVPGFSTVRDLKARTIRPDGTPVMFSAKPYEKLLIKSGGFKVMQKTFSLAEVGPGAIIEYRYKREWSLSQLMTNAWTLQRDIPILRASLWVRPWQQDVGSFFTYARLAPEEAPKKVGDHYELTLRNVPPFEAEPFAPPADELKPLVQFFYTSGKADVNVYWTDAGKAFADYIEPFIGNRSGIRKAAAELTAGAASEEEKVRRIYARVQQFRNLSFEEEKTEQEAKKEKLRDSRHVEDTWRDGYGYRTDINRLFVALVRGAGLEAHVLRVAQRDERFFSKEIPDMDQLSGEVAVVKIDGVERYFDPGTVHAPFGLLSWENTMVPALRVEKKTGGKWLETPLQEPDTAVTTRVADLHFADDILKGTIAVTFAGQEALIQRLAAHNRDEAANRKQLEDDVKGWFPEGTVLKLKSLSSLKASDEPLTAEFDIELPNLGTVTGTRALVPLSIFAASQKNPFAAEKRMYPVYFRYPRMTRDRVRLKMPEGYAVENLPKDVKVDTGGTLYSTTWKQGEDGTISLERQLTVNIVSIDPTYYKPLRAFYSRVVNGDQENVVFRKKGE